MNEGEKGNSRESATHAGWDQGGNLRQEADPGTWTELLKARVAPKWTSFSWLTVRALFESVNDVLAKLSPQLVDERRARWLAAQRGRRPTGHERLVVDRPGAAERAFFLLGDTGEQDASQYAVASLLSNDKTGPAPEPEFLIVVSDVIYPAGDVNEYVNGFYVPYQDFEKPIYGLPGNHDWYDGLNGFMYHFCGAEPLPPESFRLTEARPATRLAAFFWRGATAPQRNLLAPRRRARHWGRDSTEAVQPAPYFAIDLGDLMLVGIDTGVTGTIDEEQALWLIDTSAVPKQKVLLTGKPIYVNGAYHPGEIAWNRKQNEDDPADPRRFETVDQVVRDPGFRYLAAIGGDVHNYQRYPMEFREGSAQLGRTIHYLVSGGGGAYLSPTHRIPPICGPPRYEGTWPAQTTMPLDEELSDAMPAPGTAQGDPSAFRCYPRRGDSLAYSARRAGPRLFNAVQLAAIAFAVAVTMLLYAIPLHSTGRSGLAVAFGAPLLAALSFGAVKWVLTRIGGDEEEAEDEEDGTGEGAAKRPIAGRAAAIVLAAVVAFGLAAFAADQLSDSELLTSARFWGIVAVALLVPLLIVGAIVAAHDLRGSAPAALPELALLGAIAAAFAVECSPGPVADAPAWFVTTVGVAAFIGLGLLGLGKGRRRWPTWESGRAFRLFDRFLVVAAPAALAVVLAANTDSDRVVLLGGAIAVVGAYPFALAPRSGAGDAGPAPSGGWAVARAETAASFLAVAGWVTVAALLLQMIGDGWVAAAAIGAVAVLVIALVGALLSFLAVGGQRQGTVAICLIPALAMFPLKFICWPLFVAAVVGLLVAAFVTVRQLRSGVLNADAAEAEVRKRLRGGEAAPADGWPRDAALPPDQERLFSLLYPYRWEQSADQGAERTGAWSRTIAKLVAELSDADEPPFFKHLLRFDIRPREPDPPAPGEAGDADRELIIRCFGVTGYEAEEEDPPVEDEIVIPFHSPESVPTAQSAAPSQ